MATYTYKCSACGQVFNLKATIKEKEEGKGEKFVCPKCGAKDIKPEFSAANFIKNVFKGDHKTGACACGSDCEPEKKDKDDQGCGCGCC